MRSWQLNVDSESLTPFLHRQAAKAAGLEVLSCTDVAVGADIPWERAMYTARCAYVQPCETVCCDRSVSQCFKTIGVAIASAAVAAGTTMHAYRNWIAV